MDGTNFFLLGVGSFTISPDWITAISFISKLLGQELRRSSETEIDARNFSDTFSRHKYIREKEGLFWCSIIIAIDTLDENTVSTAFIFMRELYNTKKSKTALLINLLLSFCELSEEHLVLV